MLAAQVGVREARIREPVRAADEARERFELRLLHDAERTWRPSEAMNTPEVGWPL